MSVRSYSIVLLLAGFSIFAAGQNPPAQNAAGDSGTRVDPAPALTGIVGMRTEADDQDSVDSPQIPAFLGGQATPLAFTTEMERSNYLRGGVNVGATYDDNPLLLSSGKESNTSETIFPSISIVESTSRTRWSLGYAGGLTVNQKITTQNLGSHNLIFDSQYRLSPHLNLRVAETFSMTTGFFDAGNGTQVVGGSGGPNASLLAPLSTQRSNATTVETTYHFALNDLTGASGSFYDLHFTNVPKGTQLANSQTASATAFWLHRICRGDWGGLSYRFARITFDPNGETQVHTFMLVDTLKSSNGFTMSAFAGPQYADNQGVAPGASQPSQSTQWSVAGGVEGGWQKQRTSVTAGYSRSITDGGGILGAVRLETVHANFRREVVPGWAVSLMASHGVNHTQTSPLAGAATSINLTSAGAGLERNVGKSLGLRFGYTHEFQQQFGLPAPNPTLDAHRNRFVVTLSYQWAKPLGM